MRVGLRSDAAMQDVISTLTLDKPEPSSSKKRRRHSDDHGFKRRAKSEAAVLHGPEDHLDATPHVDVFLASASEAGAMQGPRSPESLPRELDSFHISRNPASTVQQHENTEDYASHVSPSCMLPSVQQPGRSLNAMTHGICHQAAFRIVGRKLF